MEWLFLSARILLFSSFIIATSVGDYPTGAYQAIRCMLLQTAVHNCSTVPEVSVPVNLVKAYNESPSPLHEALRTRQLAELSDAQMADLPLTLLYLIPRGRLTDLNGAQLAAILQKHAGDTSIARQITATVHQYHKLTDLIIKLKQPDLPQDVLQMLGETINLEDVNHILDALTLKEPLLAYLRPSVMFQLNETTGFDVLGRLKDIQPPKLETIYIIARMAIKIRYPIVNINWLVSGLSPDDIKNTSLEIGFNYNHFKLDLTVAKARAMFEEIYQNVVLNKSHIIDCLPVLYKLTPSMLQRLPAQEYNYDSLLKLYLPQSLPTACQIQEYVKAYCQLTGKLPKKDDETWTFRIRYLGQWVYTLPLTALKEYLLEPLKTNELLSIESPAISHLQAFYLTGKGDHFDLNASNSVKVHKVFLRAFPASQFLNHAVGDINSDVLEHLAANLPADNFPRTLAFINRTAVISSWFTFENLLDNSDINIFMSLISPNDLKAAAPQMLDRFRIEHGFSSIIRRFPQQVLVVFLDEAKKDKNWGWQNLLDKRDVSRLFVGGLTCQDIYEMKDELFIPIMAEYNKHRKEEFPRNLQICSIQKLISYLKFKMTITQTDPRLGLISLLEPVEIESVGGYVLAGLPAEALRMSPYLGHILTTIGKLSNAELILAANMTQLQSIAQLAVDKKGNADVYVARNLVWFLPLNSTVIHFKVMLQSGILDKTLCLPQELRNLLAINLIVEFGPPDMWSMGVLSTLQDLLIVFTEDELASVSRIAWTDAADILVSHYGDSVNWIKPTPFYQVCASFLEESEETAYRLAVSRLVRWRLQAAQWLLDTVNPPSHASGSKTIIDIKPLDYNDEDEKEEVTVFDPPLREDSTSTSETSTMSTTEQTEISTVTSTMSSSTTTAATSAVDDLDTSSVTTQEESKTPSLEVKKSTSVKPTPDEKTSQSPSTSVTTKNENTPSQNISHSNDDIDQKHSNNSNPQKVVDSPNESEKTIEQSKETNLNTTLPLVPPTLPSTLSNLFQTAKTVSMVTVPNINSSILNSDTSKINDQSNNEIQDMNDSNLKNSSSPLNTASNKNKTKTSDFEELTVLTKTATTPNSISNSEALDVDEIEEDPTEDENSSILDQITNSKNTVDRRRRAAFTADSTIQLTCNALRMVGPLSEIALTEEDLETMSDSEVQECRVEFGKMNFTHQIFKGFWKRIKDKKHTGTHLLGSLLRATTVGDLWDIQSWTASQPWVLETIHSLIKNVNENSVVKNILLKALNENSEPPPELLAVLGDSLCLLDEDKLNTLDPPIVGLQFSASCPSCLPFFARKAIEKLGPVSNWTQHYVYSLNSIVAGLELKYWHALTESALQPLSALQPSAITCLPNSYLEILTPDNIKSIPTLTLHALSPQQIATLNPTQIEALRCATQVSIQDKLLPDKIVVETEVPSSGSYSLSASYFLIFVSLVHLVSRSL